MQKSAENITKLLLSQEHRLVWSTELQALRRNFAYIECKSPKKWIFSMCLIMPKWMRLWKKRQVIAGIISENTPKHRISRKKSINWVRILPNQHHTGHGQCSLSQRKLFSFQSKEGSGGKRWTHKCKAKCVSSPRFFRIQVLLEALWPVVDLFLGRQRGSL